MFAFKYGPRLLRRVVSELDSSVGLKSSCRRVDLELAKLRLRQRWGQRGPLVLAREIVKEGSGRLVFQKIQQIVCFPTVRHGCVWQCCFSADCGRLSSSAGISLEGSKDSRFFPYFSAMTHHQRAAAAVREGGPCSWLERAVEPSRREPPLHPVMSSKTIFLW